MQAGFVRKKETKLPHELTDQGNLRIMQKNNIQIGAPLLKQTFEEVEARRLVTVILRKAGFEKEELSDALLRSYQIGLTKMGSKNMEASLITKGVPKQDHTQKVKEAYKLGIEHKKQLNQLNQ